LSHRFTAVSVLAIVSIAAGACRGGDRAPAGALVDDLGVPVAAGTREHPARIVSLSPATTELLFAIGAGARVVGRTHWDTYPDSARLAADVGPGLRPNVEAVLSERPELVVIYASADNLAAVERFKAAGIAVVAIKIDRIEGFRRAARLLGAAVGESARAATVVDSVDRTLARVRAATAPLSRPTVFWHVWDAPIYTIGAGSYLTELIDIAGGTNVYSDLASPSPQVSLEEIVRRDPHYVLAGPEGAARIRASRAWQGIRAVREGRVLVVDTMLVGRPSVRLGEAALALARLIHPDSVR